MSEFAVNVQSISLLATFSGTYPIFHSRLSQFPAVCHGVSVKARIVSPIATATLHSVHATEIYQRSPFSIAPAVPDHPLEGNTFPEAS